MRRWLDVLQRNLQSVSCSGNVYGYNIDGKQADVDNGGQEGWLKIEFSLRCGMNLARA